MMWESLDKPWQRAFELAWESYTKDTIPIGAVITDADGNVIAEGRNRIFDKCSTNPLAGTYMAHAEMTAMIQLKEADHPDVKSYMLYTTMEPCPMCFGTMLMVHICHLRYAARDGFAGANNLKDKTDYINGKKMTIIGDYQEMEAFQLIMQTAYEYGRGHRLLEEILNTWRPINLQAVDMGKLLFDEGYFAKAITEGFSIQRLYDEVIARYLVYKDE
jgi:tRNA(adenine34) deaminase